MSRTITGSVITANRLLDGDVVYLTPGDAWSLHLQDAAVLEHESDARRRLELAQKDTACVIDPYIVAVEAGDDGRLTPARFRETLRSRGPTNYRHGKQEDM